MADMQLVSDKFKESLSTRAEALGCKLMTDDSDGPYLVYYIYEEEAGKIVFFSAPADPPIAAVRELRRSGLTVDDIGMLFRVQPRAVTALLSADYGTQQNTPRTTLNGQRWNP